MTHTKHSLDKDLFFSFHWSRDLKEDLQFKYMIGIIPYILDVDTVINKSKPQIPITSHLVKFNIKMSLGISPALLTSEISVLCLVLFIHVFLPCASACYCLSCANPAVTMVVS